MRKSCWIDKNILARQNFRYVCFGNLLNCQKVLQGCCPKTYMCANAVELTKISLQGQIFQYVSVGNLLNCQNSLQEQNFWYVCAQKLLIWQKYPCKAKNFDMCVSETCWIVKNCRKPPVLRRRCVQKPLNWQKYPCKAKIFDMLVSETCWIVKILSTSQIFYMCVSETC